MVEPGRRALVISLAGIALGLWLISPRFAVGGPSLIDDWSAVRFSPAQVGSLGRLLSTADGRFRPGWIGWNYLQWHTLGAPGGMLGPNAWDVLRVVVFVVGVAWFAYLLCRSVDTQRGTGTTLVLAVIAPVLVVSTPQVAVDFARFGPQEPLLVGCMTLGGSLLYKGVHELMRNPGTRRAGRAAACLASGYAFWVVGVYQKEVSVSVLVLIPFLYLARRTEVNQTVAALGAKGRWLLAGLGAGVLAPVVHVAVEVALITHRGHLVYNGNQVSPGSGQIRKTVKFLVTMPSATGSIVGLLLTVAIAAQVTTSLVRRRPDWLLTGLLATALVCLAWGGQSGVFPSRYYIPSLTLVSAGLILVLARARQREQRIAVAVVLALVLGSALLAHRDVQDWATDDQRGHAMVEAVARARLSGCPVVETGIDPERTASLPILSSLILHPPLPKPACLRRGFVMFGPNPNRAIAAACPRPARTLIGAWVLKGEQLRLVRCDRLTSEATRLLANDRIQ